MALEKLKAKLTELAVAVKKAKRVDTGFLAGATYSDGTPVASVASDNEYGGVREIDGKEVYVPPRPFFRGMIAENKGQWAGQLIKIVQHNNYDTEKSFGQMGELIKGELQKSIRDLKDPPNSPVTIAKKGFDDPLIDTGHMLNSVDYEVKLRGK